MTTPAADSSAAAEPFKYFFFNALPFKKPSVEENGPLRRITPAPSSSRFFIPLEFRKTIL